MRSHFKLQLKPGLVRFLTSTLTMYQVLLGDAQGEAKAAGQISFSTVWFHSRRYGFFLNLFLAYNFLYQYHLKNPYVSPHRVG